MRWFAAKARPVTIPWRLAGPEVPHPFRFAMRNLEDQNFEVFCPIVKRWEIRWGKKWKREKALFPSYIFVLFDLMHEKWRHINSTRGVIHLLPLHAEEPLPLPPGFVEELQQRAIDAPEDVEDVVQRFERDAIVRVLRGAFSGHTGRVITSSHASTRVAVEAFAGREVVATVPTAELAIDGRAGDGGRI